MRQLFPVRDTPVSVAPLPLVSLTLWSMFLVPVRS